MGQVAFGDEIRNACEHGRAEERVGDPRNGGESDHPERAADERQCGEDAEPDRSAEIDQALAREPVDERPGREPNDDRRQEGDDEERADPPGRVGAGLDVDGQRDRRHPGADPGPERRQEEQPEASRAAEQPELAAER